MTRRAAAGRLLAIAATAVLVAACAVAPEPARPRPLAPETAGFLLPPEGAAPPALATNLAAVHQRLLAGEAPSTLRAELSALTPASSADPAVAVAFAQLDFVGGDLESAGRRIASLGPEARGGDAARLLAARVAELSGRRVDAYFLYESAAPAHAIAGQRLAALAPEAVRELDAAIAGAIAAGRFDAAAAALERLERVAPHREATLELAARVASARGDRRRELDAVRALAAAHPDRLSLQLRRGELDLEVGDAAAGLALLERLAAAHPDDPATISAWARGRFLYRVVNSPEPVRRAAARAQLDRSEFAMLLYWLVPSVRSARPAATRIATDALDHPAREEIVRVANLGLLRIDESMHVFEPHRALTRLEAFQALARLRGAPADSRADACGFALESGWIAEPSACLAAAPVSGAEAVEWLRRVAAEEIEVKP